MPVTPTLTWESPEHQHSATAQAQSWWRVMVTCEGPHVPGDVVAPADGLHPVHGAGVEPHQVAGPLDEAVDWHVGCVQVLQVGPP